jgi:hypothetical protein
MGKKICGRMTETKQVTSLDSLKSLYLAERARRSTIRGQVSVPVSIISFSIFGFVSFAQHFNVARWREPVTAAMIALMLGSMAALFAAMTHLALIERRFLSDDFDRIEAVREATSEHAYFLRAYGEALNTNMKAERNRSRAFLLLLASLGLFVVAVALLPLHLNGTGVNGR